jgi:hypothetical protein
LAQKSLPNLNKINISMIWYSTFYNKHQKWLSSQYLYFLYFFNKLTVYLDLYFFNLFWVEFEKTTLCYGFKKYTLFVKNETRFFKPVTAYLINLRTNNLIINIYYKTSLERFKSSLLNYNKDNFNSIKFAKSAVRLFYNKKP